MRYMRVYVLVCAAAWAALSVAACAAPAATLEDARTAVGRAQSVLRDFAVDITDWKFGLEASDDARLPDFDDSDWEASGIGARWQKENTYGWYRTRLTVPERLRGLPTAGRRLTFLVGIDDRGEAYVNGELQQKFEWDSGRVVLAEAAEAGTTYVIAIKAINDIEEGALRHARLVLGGTEELEARRDAFLDRLRQAAQFCSHHPAPNPALLSA
ncbi:MAG: hypothetical protein JSV65_05990, partial [Armatimonadota bacterium]